MKNKRNEILFITGQDFERIDEFPKLQDFPDISFINLNPPKLTRLQRVKRFIRRLFRKG